MKNHSSILLMLLAIITLASCSGPKAPSFENLENLKIVSANKTKIVMSGKAIYHNPNEISGMLTHSNIKIIVNDVQVTEIDQDHSIDVPKSSDFMVPVHFSFNPKDLLQENKGFLKNALKSFINKKLQVQYVGSVTVKVIGVEFDVPVDYTETFSFGMNYE